MKQMNIHLIIQTMLGVYALLFSCRSPVIKNETHQGTDGQLYRIMFYNTENLFDTYDDSLTEDEAYTPSGGMHWTLKRYNAKLLSIYKVIIAAGSWQPPDIIGLCEVENNTVLEDLTEKTPLLKFPYHIIHKNSADIRGIDVALLYNSKTVKPLGNEFYRINKRGLFTRDILYFKALLGKDTCHFFINHWPSRSSGQLETEPYRIAAAQLVKHLTDSLISTNKSVKILIMGDFNDEPKDESLTHYLMVQNDIKNPQPGKLYNLSYAPSSGPVKGTLKYQGQWNLFDQMIVSGTYINQEKGLVVSVEGYRILDKTFLLLKDEKYNGYKPFRTYNGFIYQGGFSDHLPVYLDLIYQ